MSNLHRSTPAFQPSTEGLKPSTKGWHGSTNAGKHVVVSAKHAGRPKIIQCASFPTILSAGVDRCKLDMTIYKNLRAPWVWAAVTSSTGPKRESDDKKPAAGVARIVPA